MMARSVEMMRGKQAARDAGHHRDHQQSGKAILRDDAGDDRDERAWRST
jgi:hypothetical protein